MLYQDKVLGRFSAGAWVKTRLGTLFGRRRHSDFELLAFNPHLQRDVGLEAPPQMRKPADDIWRK